MLLFTAGRILQPVIHLAAFVMFWIALLLSVALAQSQKLPTEPLEIITSRGNFTFDVEIADLPEERTIGLMNRTELDNRAGMLFVFDTKRIVTMWMKNTLIPLDMVFVNIDGVVASIAERTTPHSLALVSSGVPVDYVLELNGGIAAFIGIKPGDRLIHPLFK